MKHTSIYIHMSPMSSPRKGLESPCNTYLEVPVKVYIKSLPPKGIGTSAAWVLRVYLFSGSKKQTCKCIYTHMYIYQEQLKIEFMSLSSCECSTIHSQILIFYIEVEENELAKSIWLDWNFHPWWKWMEFFKPYPLNCSKGFEKFSKSIRLKQRLHLRRLPKSSLQILQCFINTNPCPSMASILQPVQQFSSSCKCLHL